MKTKNDIEAKIKRLEEHQESLENNAFKDSDMGVCVIHDIDVWIEALDWVLE